MPRGRYRLMNYLAARSAARKFQSPFKIDGRTILFHCDLDDSIRREVCFTGCYEPLETSLVRQLLKPGALFVDVGANWGYFSLIGSVLVGGSGRVVALEPDPSLFEELELNVRVNEFNNVTPLAVAASDQNGQAILTGSKAKAGNSGLSRLIGSAELAQGIQARTCRLDALLDASGVTDVSLMKMDIEGAEGLAVEGAAKLFESRRVKSLLLELHPALLKAHGHSADEMVNRLLAWGYAGFRIPHDPSTLRSTYYSKATLRVQGLQRVYGFDQRDAWPHYLFTTT